MRHGAGKAAKAGRKGRKRKLKPVSVAANPWDAGPAMAERLLVEPVGELQIDLDHGAHKFVGPVGVKRARRQPWIEIYHRKGLLDVRQFTIAEALANAAVGQGASDPLAALRVDVSGRDDPQAARIDARRSYFRMLRMIPEDCRPLVLHLVVEDRPLPSAGGRSNTIFMKKVCNGLNHLADVFDQIREA